MRFAVHNRVWTALECGLTSSSVSIPQPLPSQPALRGVCPNSALALQKWLSICYIFGSIVLVYLYVRWVPHYVAWVVSFLAWQAGAPAAPGPTQHMWCTLCTPQVLTACTFTACAELCAVCKLWRGAVQVRHFTSLSCHDVHLSRDETPPEHATCLPLPNSAICMAALAWQAGVDITNPDAVQKWADSCTIVMVAGLVPAMLLFGGASYWRLRYLLVNVLDKFR